MSFYDKRIRDLLTYKIFINCDGTLTLIQTTSDFAGGWRGIPPKGVDRSSVSWSNTTNLWKTPSEISSYQLWFTQILSFQGSETTESLWISSFSISRTWPGGSLSRREQSKQKLLSLGSRKYTTSSVPTPTISKWQSSRNLSSCSPLKTSIRSSWSSSWLPSFPRSSPRITSTRSISTNFWRSSKLCWPSWWLSKASRKKICKSFLSTTFMRFWGWSATNIPSRWSSTQLQKRSWLGASCLWLRNISCRTPRLPSSCSTLSAIWMYPKWSTVSDSATWSWSTCSSWLTKEGSEKSWATTSRSPPITTVGSLATSRLPTKESISSPRPLTSTDGLMIKS